MKVCLVLDECDVQAIVHWLSITRYALGRTSSSKAVRDIGVLIGKLEAACPP